MATSILDEAAVFNIAREIQSAEARELYLQQACGDQATLRARVEALLRVHEQEQSFLLSPAFEIQTASVAEEGPGSVIGKYKILEQIGEGGFGIVYMAEQREPLRRNVALKVLKPGMDSRQVIARFEAERQALALMDHPNIGRVLDGGETHTGRPYFVMELVKGIPITRYCDEHRLTPRERLGLFTAVCSAVQHAHQKGIIHRDLKPTNVLVAAYDGKPVPKLIDFGVAKALGQKLTERTLVTGFGGIVGTLEYMSPEQAEFNALDVDTRADIYSLGVLLYELLTGTTPLTHDRLKQAAMTEALRLIREEEPPRPSTRLSESKDTLASISVQRKLEPAKLTREVQGDLDWIVMKALEKDRNRRYDTSGKLAEDVERYLQGDAILARPPSVGYQFKKWVKRNKAKVIMAGLLLAALIAGIVGTSLGLLEAGKQRDDAVLARGEETKARINEAARAEGEKDARLVAQKRLEHVAKGNEILTSIFTRLDLRKVKQGTDPLEAVLAKELTKAAEELEGEAVGDPLTVAKMQVGLGNSLLGLGYPSKAIGLFVKACDTRLTRLGADHPDTLDCISNLAQAYQRAGNLTLAIPLFEETLKVRKGKLGSTDPNTIYTMGNLAAAYDDAGKQSLSLPLHEETLRLTKAQMGPEHPDTLTRMNNLAGAYQAAKKLDLALPLFEETLEARKVVLGTSHFDTLTSMNNLALCYQAGGKLELAVPLYLETLQISKARLGNDHPHTLITINNLASAYQADGKVNLAIPLYQQALQLTRLRFAPDHPDTLRCMNNLAAGYFATGKFEPAIPLFEQTLEVLQVKLGPNHPGTLITMFNLARSYQSTGKLEQAERLFRDLIDRTRKKPGVDSSDYLDARAGLGVTLLLQKKWAEAEPLLRESLAVSEKKKLTDWRTFNTRSMLGGALLGQKKYEEAERYLKEGYEGLVKNEQKIPEHTRSQTVGDVQNQLIQLYTETNKPEEVKKWQNEKAQWKMKQEQPKPTVPK